MFAHFVYYSCCLGNQLHCCHVDMWVDYMGYKAPLFALFVGVIDTEHVTATCVDPHPGLTTPPETSEATTNTKTQDTALYDQPMHRGRYVHVLYILLMWNTLYMYLLCCICIVLVSLNNYCFLCFACLMPSELCYSILLSQLKTLTLKHSWTSSRIDSSHL